MGKKFVPKNGVCQGCIYNKKVEILDCARKEEALLFRHEIMNYVEKCEIPESLAMNFDQTPSKYAAVSSQTVAVADSECVPIASSINKQAATESFGVTLDNKLPTYANNILPKNKSKFSMV